MASDTPKALSDGGKFLGTVPRSPGVIKLQPVRTVIHITHLSTSGSNKARATHSSCIARLHDVHLFIAKVHDVVRDISS